MFQTVAPSLWISSYSLMHQVSALLLFALNNSPYTAGKFSENGILYWEGGKEVEVAKGERGTTPDSPMNFCSRVES